MLITSCTSGPCFAIIIQATQPTHRGNAMARYDEPLTASEKAELARIRHNRGVRNARREIGSYNAIGKYVGGWLGLFGVLFLACWPIMIWHKPGPPSASFHPTLTGWIVEVVWLAIFIPAAVFIAHAMKQAKQAQLPVTRRHW